MLRPSRSPHSTEPHPTPHNPTPHRFKGYFYYTRTLEGAQYAVHCRRPLPPGAAPPTEADAMDESIPGARVWPNSRCAERSRAALHRLLLLLGRRSRHMLAPALLRTCLR